MSTSPLNAARYLQVQVAVRYWEDSKIDGLEDDKGEMPLRDGDLWAPVINLQTGAVLQWPAGVIASIHYKVCDAGKYWLLDEQKNPLASWSGYYVPDDLLCVETSGFGDYIIITIGPDGCIQGWEAPVLDETRWSLITQE